MERDVATASLFQLRQWSIRTGCETALNRQSDLELRRRGYVFDASAQDLVEPRSALKSFLSAALLLTLALSACSASAPARPVVVPPAPHLSGLFVSVYDGDVALDHKVEGVHVLVDGHALPDTDGAGNTSVDGLTDGVHAVRLEYSGFVGYDGTVTVPRTDPFQVSLARAIPNAGQSGFIHVCGGANPFDFCDDQGRPWLFAGYASYTLISEVAKGHDIGPFLDEAIGYGYTTIVTLGMDLGPWAHDHGFAVDPRDPNWPAWMASIYDQAAARGLRVALGVFQQAQDLSDQERRQAVLTACNVARGRWNVFLRGGNEDNVNGWDHRALPSCGDLGGVLWSTGSRGINNPPEPPNGAWAEWEGRRDPFPKAIDDAGAGAWEMYAGYPGFAAVPTPIVVIEPPFFYESDRDMYGDFRWFEPWKALRLGLNIGANFAGGTFGSSQSLETKPNGPNTAASARQFVRGMRAAFQR